MKNIYRRGRPNHLLDYSWIYPSLLRGRAGLGGTVYGKKQRRGNPSPRPLPQWARETTTMTAVLHTFVVARA